MSESTPIRLPKQLIPADGRFGSGPARVDPAALSALAATGTSYMGTSHRRDGVRSVVGAIRTALSELYGLADGYEVVLGVGGATVFWDAAAHGLIRRRSQHLVFGEFSGKFAAVARGAPFLDEPEIVESEPGTHPLPVPDPEIDAYALIHNETSTGVTMPITRPGSGDALVLVDATSAAGAVEVDPLEFDAYYFSPQKALGSDGGLWIALVSEAAVERIESIRAGDRWIPPSIDLGIALDNSRKNQTYNTPALATLFLLAYQLDKIVRAGGLGAVAEHCRRGSAIVYGWAEQSAYATPFVQDPRQRSSTTVTLDLDPSVPAASVIEALAANGIFDISGYRKLGRNQLRVGTFPNVAHEDLERLTAAIDYVVERL